MGSGCHEEVEELNESIYSARNTNTTQSGMQQPALYPYVKSENFFLGSDPSKNSDMQIVTVLDFPMNGPD